MQIKCLAIDDEPLALLQLQTMIERTPFLELVAACQDAFEALKVLQQQEVDALFVDINMPDLNGLDFVRSLAKPPLIVFTTAYSQYALDGFKVNAVDYLLKPFGMPEFQKSAAKLQRQFQLENDAQQHQPAPASSTPDDILFIKVDYRIVRIHISEIRYVESMSEYLRIYMANGESYMTLMAMKRFIELLPSSTFLRIHRSYIVNMDQVQEVCKLRLKMDASTYLPISEMYKDEVLKYIDEHMLG